MIINEDVKADIFFSDDTSISVSSADTTGSFSISSQAVSGQGFEFGAVCSSQLSATFEIAGMNRYKMLGAVIKPQIFKGGQWHNAGVFNVTSSSRYRDMITVSASDNLIWLDKTAYGVDDNSRRINLIAEYLTTERTIYQALKYVVEDIGGQTLAQSQEEIEAMPNGTINTIVFQDITADCPRDWLSWIAETLGGYAYADSDGKIAIGQFETLPTATIQNDCIQADTSDIADFTILLTGVRMSEVWDGSSGSVWFTERDGKPNSIYIELSDNWIVQGKHYLYGNAMDILGGINSVISDIPYRPFNATVHSDTLYHIGQCIQIQDVDGDFYSSVITHHSWTLYGGQKIECAGSDTRLLADTKKRTAIKRESEKLQSKIKLAMGETATEEELSQLETDGHLIEGMVYYIPPEEA